MAINLSRLRAWLNSTKLQVSSSQDFNRAALFQTIKELINQIDEIQTTLNNLVISGGSSSIADATYITETNEAAELPNSRMAVFENYITSSNAVANQLAIRGTEWSVLTNGDPATPELVWDSNGDVIMTTVI